jgi:hypothetical protein
MNQDGHTREILNKVSYHAVYDESIVDPLAFAAGNGFAGIQWAVEAPNLAKGIFRYLLPALAAADVMDYCIEVRPRGLAVESLANLRGILEMGRRDAEGAENRLS